MNAAIGLRDRVRTPRGLEALVVGVRGEFLNLSYVGGGTVTLHAGLVKLVERGQPPLSARGRRA